VCVCVCEAINSMALCLVVAYQRPEAPVFVHRLESLDVFESTPIKLECDVKGFPQPEISWFQVRSELVLHSAQ